MYTSILTIIFTFFIVTSIIEKNYIMAIIIAVLGILILISVPYIRKHQIDSIKEEVKHSLEKNLKQTVININKHPWYILELLPGFDRISAKRAVWLRGKYGQYTSIQDFFDKNNVKDEYKQQIMLIANL